MFHFYWVSMQIENVCFNSQNKHKCRKILRSDVLNTVNYHLGAVPKLPKLTIKNFPIKMHATFKLSFHEHEQFALSYYVPHACICSMWLSVSVQQLFYFGKGTCIICIVVLRNPIGWRLQPTRDSRALGIFPPMSSRHRNLAPLGRWHATIYISISC